MGGELQGAAVEVAGLTRLTEVVEADGEVVGDVGIVGGEPVGLEPRLLSVGPALLVGQEFGEGDAWGEGVGVVGAVGERAAQAAFGVPGIAALESAEAGDGNRVVRPGKEGATEQRAGLGGARRKRTGVSGAATLGRRDGGGGAAGASGAEIAASSGGGALAAGAAASGPIAASAQASPQPRARRRWARVAGAVSVSGFMAWRW